MALTVMAGKGRWRTRPGGHLAAPKAGSTPGCRLGCLKTPYQSQCWSQNRCTTVGGQIFWRQLTSGGCCDCCSWLICNEKKKKNVYIIFFFLFVCWLLGHGTNRIRAWNLYIREGLICPIDDGGGGSRERGWWREGNWLVTKRKKKIKI